MIKGELIMSIKDQPFETVNHGDRVQDKISGVTGIVVGITEWIYGCRRITIQPEETKDGSPVESCTFDEPQVKILKAGVLPTPITAKVRAQAAGDIPPHGPRPNVKQRTTPTRR